jgi:hypothetical protein
VPGSDQTQAPVAAEAGCCFPHPAGFQIIEREGALTNLFATTIVEPDHYGRRWNRANARNTEDRRDAVYQSMVGDPGVSNLLPPVEKLLPGPCLVKHPVV